MKLMFHDDDCGELLDQNGFCPRCKFHPDMQSTAFKEVPDDDVRAQLKEERTFIGQHRTAIVDTKARKKPDHHYSGPNSTQPKKRRGT